MPDVAEGATEQLPLTLTTETVGNGIAAGTDPGPDGARSTPATRSRRCRCEFTADLRKPLNVYRFVVALIAALLASAPARCSCST